MKELSEGREKMAVTRLGFVPSLVHESVQKSALSCFVCQQIHFLFPGHWIRLLLTYWLITIEKLLGLGRLILSRNFYEVSPKSKFAPIRRNRKIWVLSWKKIFSCNLLVHEELQNCNIHLSQREVFNFRFVGCVAFSPSCMIMIEADFASLIYL